MEGSKDWFGVEAKSFEILVEVLEGRVVGKPLDQSRGFFSGMRFREGSLVTLHEGLEEWCQEGGRSYELELCSNVAGCFVLCSVSSVELKHFSLGLSKRAGVFRVMENSG